MMFSKAFYNKTTILEFPNSHFKSKLFFNQNKPYKINITTLECWPRIYRISSHKKKKKKDFYSR